MNLSELNWMAIIAATLSNFVIGGLWYSNLLFAKPWMRENKFTPEILRGGNMFKIYGLTFIFAFIMALNLAMFLNDPSTTASWGAFAGFLAGFGWVAMAYFITGQFEKKSATLMLINAGYFVVSLTVMGLILGAWR
jgi:hypothetical protein